MGRDVKFAVSGPIVRSGDLAWCLTEMTCRHQGKPDDVYRVSYNWQRRGGEWKSICEMMGVGGL